LNVRFRFQGFAKCQSVGAGLAQPRPIRPRLGPHSEEPQQRCNLSLYRIPPDSAHPAALLTAAHLFTPEPADASKRCSLKSETPRQTPPGRFG